MDFDEFIRLSSKIENIPLTAELSHLKMVPPFRRDLLQFQSEAIKKAKKAGVLALFYPDETNQTKFILILRKTYEGVHSAQISFPGGKLEKHDLSLKDAAIRETFEEIGVPINDINVLLELSQVYIPPSNFYVYPFIAVTKNTPLFYLQADEVEDIIEVNLKDFLNDDLLITTQIKTSYSLEVEVPAFQLNGFIVWGATAMILSEIKDMLKQLM